MKKINNKGAVPVGLIILLVVAALAVVAVFAFKGFGFGLGPEYAFADRGVESPDDVGDPQGRMSFQFSFVHLS